MNDSAKTEATVGKAIWKYELKTADSQVVPMPSGARLLTVQTQHHQPCLWVEVDTSAGPAERLIFIHGTGHPIEHNGCYVGTYQMFDGDLIWHVYDDGEVVQEVSNGE